MKCEISILMDINVDKDKYPDITDDEVVNSITVQDSDVIDGFELTTEIRGCDKTKDYFLNNAIIIRKKRIS